VYGFTALIACPTSESSESSIQLNALNIFNVDDKTSSKVSTYATLVHKWSLDNTVNVENCQWTKLTFCRRGLLLAAANNQLHLLCIWNTLSGGLVHRFQLPLSLTTLEVIYVIVVELVDVDMVVVIM